MTFPEQIVLVRLRNGYHQGHCRIESTDECRARREGLVWSVEVDADNGRWERFGMKDVDVVAASEAKVS